ncbi:MAG TPA: archaeosortase/exosortase family protein [Candidatus Xenobia bacterium]|jgi:exosortase/archaeosortase family protein
MVIARPSSINNADRVVLSGLALGAIAIWGLVVQQWDPVLGPQADGGVVVCLPLFVWLGGPWRFSDRPIAWGRLALAAALCVAGLTLKNVLLGTVGWNLALWAWLSSRLTDESQQRARAAFLLPLLAFPWLSLDGHVLCRPIRVVDAWGMEHLFDILGISATRLDTVVSAPGISFKVVDGCAGLGTLHSMFIAGAVMALFQKQPLTRPAALFKVAALAFLANSIRIICIGALGLAFGAAVAEGPMHDWTGWILVLVFFHLAFPALPRPLVVERYRPEQDLAGRFQKMRPSN